MIRLLAFALLVSSAYAADIKIAVEDEHEWPWTSAAQDGLDETLVKQAAQQAGLTIVFQSLPRKRAFEQLKNGEIDGVINLSFKPERLEFLAYPMSGDKADTARGLHVDSNSVFVKSGDPLTWDGKEFKNLTGAIGALAGHGSADSLKKLGLKVDDGTKTIAGQLEKVGLGRIQAAVLPSDAAKLALSKNTDLAKTVVALPTPYSTKSAYLAFSKPFYRASPEIAEKFWMAVVSVRDSESFKNLAKDYQAKGE
jgi:polar amino acid transport system substrate-binding protein